MPVFVLLDYIWAPDL